MRADRWFWLYRPTAPSVRAQSIQVVNAAHAMACRGHAVTLAVDPSGPGVDADAVLEFYGLRPVPTLTLTVLPQSRSLGSAAYRALFAAWMAGGGGIALARSVRHAQQARRVFGRNFRLVFEAHDADAPQELLRECDALLANAPGTLEALRERHSSALPPAAVAHNGTRCTAFPEPRADARGALYVGSLRRFKDLHTVARAAAVCSVPITLVGADASDPLAEELGDLSDGRLRFEAPVAHRDVPARLSAARLLVLPLARDDFGERLTSPLKLWDALASGVPLVAADTLAVRRAAVEGAFMPYEPGDAESLRVAIERVQDDESVRERLLQSATVRTWANRAREIAHFVESVP